MFAVRPLCCVAVAQFVFVIAFVLLSIDCAYCAAGFARIPVCGAFVLLSPQLYHKFHLHMNNPLLAHSPHHQRTERTNSLRGSVGRGWAWVVDVKREL